MNLFKWGSSSLPGHIVLWELIFSTSGFLFFVAQSDSAGTLTLRVVLWTAFVWGAAGALAAIVFWYAVTLPLLVRRKGKDK